MARCIVSVVVEVQPQGVDQLRTLISQLRTSQAALNPPYPALQAIKSLHFLSMTVFADARYDPLFVIEANFDPPAGPFWADLDAAIGTELREMFRCCKRPPGPVGLMFDAVTVHGAKMSLAPFLEAQALVPTVGYEGARGMSRARIEQEAAVFLDLRETLKDPRPFHDKSPAQIHSALRNELLPRHACLREEPPPRLPLLENIGDWVKMIGLVLAIVVILHLPGMLLAWVVPPLPALAVILLAGAPAAIMLKKGLEASHDNPAGAAIAHKKKLTPGAIKNLLIALGLLLIFDLLVALAIWRIGGALNWGGDFQEALIIVGFGLAGAFVLVALIAARLRQLEQLDPTQEFPPPDSRKVREIMALEDKIPQNHMSSLVQVKPGLLRAILMRAGLVGLGFFMRAQPEARRGFLAGVRTIHFAQVAPVSNGGRLMFLTNFDGSWENYLNDFTEKVHLAVTLVWTNGVGFPPTRFLILDGASRGRLFKAWKRHSMAPSLFWFSAYRHLSVEQIERDARLAEGLRQSVLTSKKAEKWAMDL
ncbi:MAG TPA: hypothetical protein VFW13_04125 [Phenylobacterium sp.]|nr:hypothetical protein [Phenylobacterium sp.]